MFFRVEKCRGCQSSDLVPVLNIGTQPLANDFRRAGEECAGYAPLEVLFCRRCTLAQLSVFVRPEIMYRDYSYVTSPTNAMKLHFNSILDDIGNEFRSPLLLKCLEIGSNDGTFLHYADHQRQWMGYGIEPAKNLCELAEQRQVKCLNRFFDTDNAVLLGSTGYRADVVVARHVFAHIDDWQGFIHALSFVTNPDSLVFIEVPYVGDMLKMNSWDQVYHEHLSYVSITAMKHLLAGSKFRLHRVIKYPIHGGAVGIMLRRKDCSMPETDSVTEFVENEKDLQSRWEALENKQKGMVAMMSDILLKAGLAKKTVCGFGASAKATVWLNALGSVNRHVQWVCDSTEQKQGRLVPGTAIPVEPEGMLVHADVAIMFCWNFHAAVLEKNKDWQGQWIVPVPFPNHPQL